MNGKYILLYDQDCPLCKAYTNFFVNKGFIDKKYHISFQNGIDRYRHVVDEDRAHNEIACIDVNSNHVFYGAKGFFKVVGQRFPWLEWFSNLPLIASFISKLYFFISYNRNIIVKKQGIQCACAPAKNWTYRILFMLLTFWFTSVQVQYYFENYFGSYLQHNAVSDYLLMLGQYAFLTICFVLLKQKNNYDYLGTIAFVTFIGALILAIGNGIFQLFELFQMQLGILPEVLYGMVFFIMFHIHNQRSKSNEWTHWLTICWLAFRIGIYFLVFNF